MLIFNVIFSLHLFYHVYRRRGKGKETEWGLKQTWNRLLAYPDNWNYVVSPVGDYAYFKHWSNHRNQPASKVGDEVEKSIAVTSDLQAIVARGYPGFFMDQNATTPPFWVPKSNCPYPTVSKSLFTWGISPQVLMTLPDVQKFNSLRGDRRNILSRWNAPFELVRWINSSIWNPMRITFARVIERKDWEVSRTFKELRLLGGLLTLFSSYLVQTFVDNRIGGQ